MPLPFLLSTPPFISTNNILYSAAKTALLLDNTQLGPTQVQVTSSHSIDEIAGSATKTESGHSDSKDSDEIEQEDKPRSRIVAEYLAHGYVLGDQALHRAIDLDNKHGISHRFTQALANFDSKTKATDKARSLDASYGVTNRATSSWRGLSSYFEKALGTPTGQKVVEFYSKSEKQVMDIHAEALRLANLKKEEQAPMGIHGVPGTDKTECNCAGNDGQCPCEEGKCNCKGCGKSGRSGEKGDHSATGPAPEVAEKTHVQPLGSNMPGEAVGSGAEIAGSSGLAPGGGNVKQ